MISAQEQSHQTEAETVVETPVYTDIAEYTTDGGLLDEIEVHGSKWLIVTYTDQLETWKKVWKKRCATGEGKNQSILAELRTEEDILLREGAISQTPSLTQIYDTTVLVSNLNGPMNSGIDRANGILYSPCSQEIIAINIESGKEINRITLPLFNDLHSVSFNQKTETMMVVSSGADKVIEIDRSGKIIWKWDATNYADELGLINEETKQRRTKLVDVKDYREWVVPTPAQTTHINTATWLDESHIGVTLFHQGIALVVNKETNTTQIVATELVKPHGFQPTEDGKFIVTSTGQGKVLVLDHEFKIIEEITGFFDGHPADEISWIHTTFPIGEKLVALDQTLAEMVIFDLKSKRIQRIKHPHGWKVAFIDRV
ncbi:hypothetical protein KKD03_01905 [Patescibacteria group bacterium]|nr:hypothetical protein [Patescibacteria group bacterium]